MAWIMLQELGRKIIHITILIVLVIYAFLQRRFLDAGYSEMGAKQIALLFPVCLLVLFLVLEYFRLELGWKVPYFSQFIRAKEQNRMSGVVYFLSATIICLSVFDYSISLTALLLTTFGDMMAALFGKKYGTTLIYRNKTWAGFVAELITNLIVGLLILYETPGFIYIVIGMAAVATIVETMVDELDDNLLVPIFCGFIGQIILFAL